MSKKGGISAENLQLQQFIGIETFRYFLWKEIKEIFSMNLSKYYQLILSKYYQFGTKHIFYCRDFFMMTKISWSSLIK